MLRTNLERPSSLFFVVMISVECRINPLKTKLNSSYLVFVNKAINKLVLNQIAPNKKEKKACKWGGVIALNKSTDFSGAHS
ncbi:hypothetical protein GCM10009133_28460 [Cocleimonas flava]